MGYKEHEKLAQKKLNIAVLTLSDTRDKSNDKSGKIITELLKNKGHKIIFYKVIKENKEIIASNLQTLVNTENLDAIITNGGTGLTSRDNTIETARKIFDKELPGFGEIFRYISYQQIGAAAILSRATAGTANNKIIICLPGSSKAVALAINRIIIPQIAHMVWETNR